MTDKLFSLRDLARFLLPAFCDGIRADEVGDDRTPAVVDDDTSAASCAGSDAGLLEANLERTRFDDLHFARGTCCVVLRPHVQHSETTRSLLIPLCAWLLGRGVASIRVLGAFVSFEALRLSL